MRLRMMNGFLNSRASTDDEIAAQWTNRLDIDQTIDEKRPDDARHRALPQHSLTSAELRTSLKVQLLMCELQFLLNATVVPASKIELIPAPT